VKLGLESFSTRTVDWSLSACSTWLPTWTSTASSSSSRRFGRSATRIFQQIRNVAEAKGLYLEFGMGSILHWHPMAEKGRQLLADAGRDTSVSDAQIVIEHLHVAKKLGSPILRCVVGNFLTRDEGHDMTALADQAVVILREACRAAEDLDMKIAVETHADFTVREHVSILDRVNSPSLGFTVDCANLAFDLDDPLRLAGIVAPYALTTHYKNYRIIRTSEGLALENLCSGRWRNRHCRNCGTAGTTQLRNQPKYRNPCAICPLSAGRVAIGMAGPASVAARRRLRLVPGEVLEKSTIGRAARQPSDGAATWELEAEQLRAVGPLGQTIAASSLGEIE